MSEKHDDGGGAFPSIWWDRDSTGEIAPRDFEPGMSALFYAAVHIAAALIAHSGRHGDQGDTADFAFKHAAALVAESRRRAGEGES